MNWRNKFYFNTGKTSAYDIYSTDWHYPNNVIDDSINTINSEYRIRRDDNINLGNGSSTKAIYYTWTRHDYLLNNDEDFSTFYFSKNLSNNSQELTSEMLIANNFNFDIPTGSTILGIKLKLIRKSFPLTDKLAIGESNPTNNNIDDLLFYLKSHTRDNIVTISSNSSTTLTHENKAETFIDDEIIYNTGQTTDTFKQQLYKNYNIATGIWSNEKETKIYGGCCDLWQSGNSDTWTPDIINSNDFSVKLQVIQRLFKSYGTNSMFNAWSGFGSGLPSNNASFLISRYFTVGVKIYYTLSSDSVYDLTNLESYYNKNNTLNISDIYFNNRKCLNGVCYNYIKDTKNIYNLSYMTGDGYSINNLYNEYNIIDKYFKNVNNIDIAVNYNISLSGYNYTLDNTKLKVNNTVLLTSQIDESENGLYYINENFKLIKSNILDTRENSFRSSFFIKNGTKKGIQYFLINNGNEFPTIDEPKCFESGHSYMLKNIINYNTYNTTNEYLYDSNGKIVQNPCKMLFANYDIARSINGETSKLYNYLDIPLNNDTVNYINKIQIEYLGETYIISDEKTLETYLSGYTISNISGYTNIDVETDFYSGSTIGDYVKIKLYTGSGDTSFLNLITKIKNKSNSKIILYDIIPTYILNEYNNSDYFSYRITNINYTNYSGLTNYLNLSPFGDIIDFTNIEDKIRLTPINSIYNRYFDYSLLNITHILSGITSYSLTETTYNFTSDYKYSNYKLYDFIYNLTDTPPVNIYNENYLLSTEYTFVEFENKLKITPNDLYKYKLNNFKKNTYLDLGTLTLTNSTVTSPYEFIDTVTGRTMIYDITTDYMLINIPKNFNYNVDFDMINISKLIDISNILYDVYINISNSYYNKLPDNTRYNITAAYANIIKSNKIIRSLTSGILYKDSYNFNLDIFDINIDSNFNHNDINLTYYPVELIDIGSNKITKLPFEIDIDELNVLTITDNVLTGFSYNYYNTVDNYSKIAKTYYYNDKLYVIGYWQDAIMDSTFDNPFTYTQPSNKETYNNIFCAIINNDLTGYKFYPMRTIFQNYSTTGDLYSTILTNVYIDSNENIIIDGYNKNVILKSSILKDYNSNYEVTVNDKSLDYPFTISINTGDTLYATTNEMRTSTLIDNIGARHTYDKKSFGDSLYVCGFYYRYASNLEYKPMYNYNFNIPTTTAKIGVSYILNTTGSTYNWYNVIYINNSSGVEDFVKIKKICLDTNKNVTYGFGYCGIGIDSEIAGKLDLNIYNDIDGEYKITNIINAEVYNNILLLAFDENGKYIDNNFVGYCNYSSLTTIENYIDIGDLIFSDERLYYSLSFTDSIIYNNIVESGTGSILISNYEDNISWYKFFKSLSKTTTKSIVADESYIYIPINYISDISVDGYIIEGSNDTVIFKLNKTNGRIVSYYTMSSTNNIYIEDLKIKDDNLYISGYFNGHVYFGNNLKYSLNYNYFVYKIKTNF